ncbi:hypothetical protein SY88_11330 [Clostridiales bacterium PH28_bin88]|nr:hypothetical protein SY88_11330 [Clostridiales bacterium PH28_bin88]
MIIGLDVGGTHVDAVLLKDNRVLRQAKAPTGTGDLLRPIHTALDSLLAGIAPRVVKQVNLSTTVCTNAIVEGKVAAVGMLLESGPGVDPSHLACSEATYFLSGAVDHRGRETAPVDHREVEQAARELQKKGIRHVGVVGKFSARNPDHELEIGRYLTNRFTKVTLGHTLSGRLNFPRRVYSTYLNVAVSDVYAGFAAAVRSSFHQKGLTAPVHILKADGGTLTLDASLASPVETILSGPAASIMGVLALCAIASDAVVLDIGGTTTDIALLADGVPLLEPRGIRIGSYPTLVRALLARPVGVGGDSRVQVIDGRLQVGPHREGPAVALGGLAPTPTDALVALGMVDLGNRELALHAMAGLGKIMGLDAPAAARRVFQETVDLITKGIGETITDVNSRPAYTVREVLMGRTIQPTRVIVIGGPAEAMAPALGERLRLPVMVPPYSGVANAVGAAASKTTAELTLLADTARGILTVPEEGLTEKAPAGFSLGQARTRALELLKHRAVRMGAGPEGLELEILEEQSFNMVRGFSTAGKDIRVKAQVKPGVQAKLTVGGEERC